MIHMGLLNIIRRMHLRQKLSIREIARRTGLSRNTVTKHLAADTVEPPAAPAHSRARTRRGWVPQHRSKRPSATLTSTAPTSTSA